ncbi:acetyltransferase [Ureibacillus sp. NPDC094379]
MEIILIGDSGHAKVIRDCVESCGNQVIAMLDDKYDEITVHLNTIKAPIEHIEELMKVKDRKVVIAIGNNTIRKKIVERLSLSGHEYATIVHKKAIVSHSVEIGIGSVIMPGVIINADSKIGNHCIINSSSIIEHDSVVEDYAHISPNSTLTGGVYIREGVHMGAGSIVIPLKSVGDWSIVGAGAVVVNDLPSFCTAVGSPAKAIKFHEESI